MRRILFGFSAVCLVGLLLAFAVLRSPALQDSLATRVVDRMVASSPDELFEPDALRVLLCGTSSPLPHPDRAKPCVAVFAAGRFWVVDTGPGSWNRLAMWRVPGERIGAVLLTHFHSDHIGELGEFDLQTWAAGRPGPLPVFGPPGVERVVTGFEEAYALDTGYRIAHHGPELMRPDAGPMEARVISSLGSGRTTVLEEDGLVISAFSVDHHPVTPAVGYRFDYRGRSIVVSGDTARHPGVVEASRGVDVLLHEAQANHLVAIIGKVAEKAGRARIAKIMSDIPDYHTTPVEAAEIANEAGVGLLVLYHLTPPPPSRLVERIYTRGVGKVRSGDWILADDGLLVELPSGSTEVRTRQLD